MKVLLVDSDADLLDVTTYALRREGFDVVTAADGAQAIERWTAELPDIVVLDLGLRKVDGFQVCRRIRLSSLVPIMLLATAGDENEILRGLELGADDYMTKPFSLRLMAARLRASLRRCDGGNLHEQAVGEVRAGDLVLSLETHRALNRHGVAQLTPLEFKVLYLLAMNEGRVIPYARLVDYAWGFEGGDSNVLKSHVCHIRKKLRLPDEGPGSIRSLFGVGYTLMKSLPDETPTPLNSRKKPSILRRRAAALPTATSSQAPRPICGALRRLRSIPSGPCPGYGD